MFDFEDLKATEQSAPLDLKLGNICNSKCRICTSFASSQWAKEEIAIDPKRKNRYLLLIVMACGLRTMNIFGKN